MKLIPQSEFKVGDWVLFQDKYAEIISICYSSNIFFAANIRFIGNIESPSYGILFHALQKVDPSEVMIEIGSLKGMVRKCPTDLQYFNMVKNNVVIACIRLDALDHETRCLVEKLLVQQEEK